MLMAMIVFAADEKITKVCAKETERERNIFAEKSSSSSLSFLLLLDKFKRLLPFASARTQRLALFILGFASAQCHFTRYTKWTAASSWCKSNHSKRWCQRVAPNLQSFYQNNRFMPICSVEHNQYLANASQPLVPIRCFFFSLTPLFEPKISAMTG